MLRLPLVCGEYIASAREWVKFSVTFDSNGPVSSTTDSKIFGIRDNEKIEDTCIVILGYLLFMCIPT